MIPSRRQGRVAVVVGSSRAVEGRCLEKGSHFAVVAAGPGGVKVCRGVEAPGLGIYIPYQQSDKMGMP